MVKCKPKIYIVLVNYNGTTDTNECIDSLLNIRYSNFKVVIVDNNSETNQIESLISLDNDKVEIILNDTNVGFSGGNNIGIEHALKNGADYICILNNDTVVETDFLNELLNRFECDTNVGVCCPQIRSYYEQNVVTYGGGEINYLKGGVYIFGINEINEGKNKEARYISFATGCCSLIKREVFEKIGLLPENYFLYYEDTDFSVKVQSKYKIWYEPKAVIYHKESVSTGKYSDNYQYYFVRNRLIFIRDNFSLKQKLSAYPITCLYIIKKIIEKNFMLNNVVDALNDYIHGRDGKR